MEEPNNLRTDITKLCDKFISYKHFTIGHFAQLTNKAYTGLQYWCTWRWILLPRSTHFRSTSGSNRFSTPMLHVFPQSQLFIRIVYSSQFD